MFIYIYLYLYNSMYILVTCRRVTLPIFLFVRVFSPSFTTVCRVACVTESVIRGVRIVYACLFIYTYIQCRLFLNISI